MRRWLYPLLDPANGPTRFFRKLTRDRTDDYDGWPPAEYVCTISHSAPLRRALRSAKYRRIPLLSTLKYVEDNQKVVWEAGDLKRGAFQRGGENQQHAYWFRGLDGYHIHHHREWPILNPQKHQHGSRTHGDPEGILRNALSEAGIQSWRMDNPEYLSNE